MTAAQQAFCRAEGLAPDAFGRLLAEDAGVIGLARRLEMGEVGDREFEARVAEALGESVVAEGLVARLFADLELDRAMVEAVSTLRANGVRTVLVTNSYGHSAYRWDLDLLTDARVVSGDAGVAKPSRGIYELGLAEAGVEAADAVFVDDMRINVDAAREYGMEGILHVDAAATIPLLAAAFGVELRSPEPDPGL